MDATIIHAPSSTKNKHKKTRSGNEFHEKRQYLAFWNEST